jgi:tRNA 5-methylaminomethyl-2-thiouridine biosynthesis bifunctional protein
VTSPVTWGPDGTPRSSRFDDVYRSRGFHGMDRGLLQARHVFLQGCGLWSPEGAPRAWQGRRQWHVLETGFGLGLSFLATWHAWQQDPQRPDRLFFTSIEAWPVSAQDIERSVAAWPQLQPMANELARIWRGLLPGVHRLVFEGGRVQLTLCVGPVDKMLRETDVPADSVFLDGFSPEVNPDMWSLHTLKAVARLCRTGTRVASWCVKRSVREDLAQCGFAVTRADGLPPKSHRLEAVFSPAWTPRTKLRAAWPTSPSRTALVLGAGLSGSAVACSLARRGWTVTVLDAGHGVGAGASGLPAGLTAPHVSPDDSVLSRITRAGVRATLQRCTELLQPGTDWAFSGVLEHRVEGKRALPAGEAWPAQGHEWSTPATPEQIAGAGLPGQAQALWHAMAAWLRPRQLVAAQLATPGIEVRWSTAVHALRQSSRGWQVLDAKGQVLAEADQLIVAGGFHTRALLPEASLPLNPLRGQISMGALSELPDALRAQLPEVPVNGHGSFITGVPLPPECGEAPGWYLGSTFERACPQAVLRDEDHAANHARLATLLPTLSEPMRPAFALDRVLAWAGLRCTLPDRLPAIGAVNPLALPGLHVCAGMGARGISLGVLSGELIAAELEGEPLPLAPSLAAHLKAQRFSQAPASA